MGTSRSILNAKQIMLENNIGCLPIVDDNHLIGILTLKDVYKLEKIPIDHGKNKK